jgi:hypothetical protein
LASVSYPGNSGFCERSHDGEARFADRSVFRAVAEPDERTGVIAVAANRNDLAS